MRRLVPIAMVAALAACPSYDAEPYVSSDKGLLDADQWAGYGPEQAVAGLGAILLMALALAGIVHGAEARISRLEPDALLELGAYVAAMAGVAVA